MPKRVTLRDIAERAQVHISTVSLALKRSPLLKKETRERILTIAEELGYTPDPMLAALVAYSKRSRTPAFQATLAWIDNWPRQGELRKVKAFNEYFLGAQERAHQLGYKLEEFWLHAPGITLPRVADILRARNIQGLIVAPQEHDGNALNFDFSHFSAVALGYSLRPARLHIVTNHQAQSISLLVQKLSGLGYKRVGLYMHPDWDKKVNHACTSGFSSAQKLLPEKTVCGRTLPKTSTKRTSSNGSIGAVPMRSSRCKFPRGSPNGSSRCASPKMSASPASVRM